MGKGRRETEGSEKVQGKGDRSGDCNGGRKGDF